MADAPTGLLPELYVSVEASDALLYQARKLPKIRLSVPQRIELILLLCGAYFPLKGYMSEAQCNEVALGKGDSSPTLWPVQVVLEQDPEFAPEISPGDDVALTDDDGAALAILSVTDRWISAGGSLFYGGKVKGLVDQTMAGQIRPNQIRALIRDGGVTGISAAFRDMDGQSLLVLSGSDARGQRFEIGAVPVVLPEDPGATARVCERLAGSFGAQMIE